ncbi:MAG TPA: tetratricopeptide repeat protein [Thermosynechococcus sp. M3746_W2019_013]|nr:tetratricopeptide repeat protein [Thermosynechococcus sp. M3746_W2019_013]
MRRGCGKLKKNPSCLVNTETPIVLKTIARSIFGLSLVLLSSSVATAQVVLPRTLELNPKEMEQNGFIVAQEALQLAQFQQFQDALVRAKLAVQLAPQAHEIWALLGGLYLTVNQPQEAVPALEQALKLNTKNPAAYFNLGTAHFRLGQYGAAVRAIAQGLALKPDATEEWFNLGNAYLKLGEKEQAIAQYRRVLRLDRQFWPAYTNIGLVLYEQGRIQQAAKNWEQAADIDPKASEPKLALATALLRLGQEERAIQLAEEALRLDSRYGTVEFQRENLWGDRLVADTQTLLAKPPLRALMSQLEQSALPQP